MKKNLFRPRNIFIFFIILMVLCVRLFLYDADCYAEYHIMNNPDVLWTSNDPAGWLFYHRGSNLPDGILQLNGVDTPIILGGSGHNFYKMIQYSKTGYSSSDQILFKFRIRYHKNYIRLTVKPEDDLSHFFGGKKKVITFTRQTVDKMPPLPAAE